MASISRRSLLQTAGTGFAWLALGGNLTSIAQEEDPLDIAWIILEALEADPESIIGLGATTPANKSRLLTRISEWSTSPLDTEAYWPVWSKSLDFVPGLNARSAGTAELTWDALYSCSNRFNLSPDIGSETRTLFGIRGAMLSDPEQAGTFELRVPIVGTTPDHRNMHCLIGVMDNASRKICVYPGSTVPEAVHIKTNLLKIGGCNTPILGKYRYRVGLHGQSKKFKQPGALLQNGDILVLRAVKDPVYDVADPNCYWDILGSTSNLHSAVFTGRNPNSPKFSSAGCQIVKGSYDQSKGWVPTDDFARFRASAGLNPLPVPNSSLSTSDDGRLFEYLLFSFTDLNAETSGRFGSSKFLRFGSNGADVRALQSSLRVGMDSQLGPRTMLAYLASEQARGVQEHPIVPV